MGGARGRTEIAAYLKAYAGRAFRGVDPAVRDDLVEVTLAIYRGKFAQQTLSCKPTALAVAIFRPQLQAYWRRLYKPAGGKRGRPKAPRFAGEELGRMVRAHAKRELPTAMGKRWAEVWNVVPTVEQRSRILRSSSGTISRPVSGSRSVAQIPGGSVSATTLPAPNRSAALLSLARSRRPRSITASRRLAREHAT